MVRRIELRLPLALTTHPYWLRKLKEKGILDQMVRKLDITI